MSVTQIIDHVARAKARVIQQYKEKQNLLAIIEAITNQIQDIEDALYQLLNGRLIDNAVGIQLDRIGTIVVLTRPIGLGDNFYRALLYAKIGQNTSQGETEKVLNVFRLATQSNTVNFQDCGLAGHILMGSGGPLSPQIIDLVRELTQGSSGAGIRVDEIGYFDETDAFAFAGSGGTAKGFGDDTNPATGGQFGYLYDRTEPEFSFATADETDNPGGFGSLNDPILGGQFS
jgi:hypothetical protein